MLFSSASPDFLIYGNRDALWSGFSFPESELHRQQLVDFPVSYVEFPVFVFSASTPMHTLMDAAPPGCCEIFSTGCTVGRGLHTLVSGCRLMTKTSLEKLVLNATKHKWFG